MSKKTKALDVGNFGLENTKAKGIIFNYCVKNQDYT